MSERDRDLGMNRRIAHRDFLNGVAIRVGGALATCGFPGLLANSDAAAAAYTDQAMDQGYRAVHELLSL